jgi:hypothetical protein
MADAAGGRGGEEEGEVVVLYVSGGMHHKNHRALTSYAGVRLHQVYAAPAAAVLERYKYVYSPATPLDAASHPRTRFLFGPHFSVKPEETSLARIRGPNATYVQPSEWVKRFWEAFPACDGLTVAALPFAVDVERFCPSGEKRRDRAFIYFKHRAAGELAALRAHLASAAPAVDVTVFSYGSYDEEAYLAALRECAFGVWLSGHESQGFALQEALAADVPLLVWDARCMTQEEGQSYAAWPCTSAPYWDESCGELFDRAEDLPAAFERLQEGLAVAAGDGARRRYSPRDFVMRTLSRAPCEARFLRLLLGEGDAPPAPAPAPRGEIVKTFYINLERRADRRAQVEAELERLGLTEYERYAAHDCPGGCNLSHTGVLRLARERGYENVLVLEDDFLPVVSPDAFWAALDRFFSLRAPYDVLMLAHHNVGPPLAPGPCEGVARATGGVQTASAYLVHRRFYDSLIALLEEGTRMQRATGRTDLYVNDQIWKSAQRDDGAWYCLVPAVSKQRASYSDLAQRYVDYGV